MTHQSLSATTSQFTITLPTINFDEAFKKSLKGVTELFSNIYNPISRNVASAPEETVTHTRQNKSPRLKFDKSKLKIILPIIIGVIVIAALVGVVRSLPDAKSTSNAETKSLTAPDTLATINLDRKFSFPLKDEKGETVGTFDYIIQSATLQNQIIVQGQRATAVEGRIFLILNLKITNKLKKTIQLNTRDYVRVVTASDPKEQLAPDIHNDPVEVQAISTKFTRVGIALKEEDVKKTIQLKVGEIDGVKQNIDLNFKY